MKTIFWCAGKHSRLFALNTEHMFTECAHMRGNSICCKRCSGASQQVQFKEHPVAQCFWEENDDIQGAPNDETLVDASTIYTLGAVLPSDEIKRKFNIQEEKKRKREQANKSLTSMNTTENSRKL